MLKTTKSPNMSKSKIRNGNDEVVRFGVGSDGSEKLAKKLGKSKGQNLAKFQKLSKSEKSKDEKLKKLSKSGNLSNFNTTETKPSFLTPGAREAFNRLRLAFSKAPILGQFDPEYHIWIENDISSYTISGVLSQ